MIIKDFLDKANKEKRRKERIKAAQNIAVGLSVVATAGVATGILIAPESGKDTRENMKKKAISTVETIKDTLQKKADAIKDSADDAKFEVNEAVEEAKEKTESVKKDIKEGYDEITNDISKTAKNISSKIQ